MELDIELSYELEIVWKVYDQRDYTWGRVAAIKQETVLKVYHNM